MAGTQRESRSPSSQHTTPVRLSPSGSIDDSLDLLTGTFSLVGSNPFVVDAVGGRNGIGGAGGATSSTSPVQLNPNAVAGDLRYNPMQQQPQHPQQQQPMDLLTGLFPHPASPPPNLVVPADVVAKQDAWKEENQVHSSAGGSSTEYFATTPIATENLFVDNVVNSNASYFASPPYAVYIVSDAAVEMSSHGNRNMSRPVDGSFAKFTSVTDNISNVDLGSRSHSSSSAGPPPPSPSPQNRSHRSSPGSKFMHTHSFNNSFNNHKSGGSVNSSYSTDSSYRIESISKQSSLPSGIGLERLQQTPYPRAETPRSATPPDVNSSPPVRVPPGVAVYPVENTRTKSEQKNYQRAPSFNISSRSKGKEALSKDSRTSGSASKAVVHEEFVGANSGKAIYRAPRRGAVHPSRPVSLELRPHPLRGAPSNPVTRLTCFNSSVWAACELGIMVWDVENATGRGSAGNGNNLGDEDAASYEFMRLQGSTTMSMAADVANMVAWTGHRDGKIRLWSAPPSAEFDASCNKWDSRSPSLVFQAHRFAVTALVITSYGTNTMHTCVSVRTIVDRKNMSHAN